MKNRIIIYLLGLSTLLVMLTGSCRGLGKENCEDGTTACGTFSACCTATQCYYLYDGQKYNCDGTDCYDAASDLANDMCNGYKSANESIDESVKGMVKITKRLSREISDCSSCN